MDIVWGMRLFVAVVEGHSFAAGAERENTSRAVASRAIAQLEDHLGTRLLNRTTRRLSLTESGTVFYERSQQILADVAEAEQLAGHMATEPRGVLKASMPLSYGLHVLGPIVAEYEQRHPKVRLDLSLNDRKVDLVEEGFDLAIRIGTLQESGLIARRLSADHSRLAASPAYLARHGTPRTPEDLQDHVCLGYSLTHAGEEWRLQGPDGATSVVRCNGPIKADNGDLLRIAATQGVGIVLQPGFILSEDLAAGRLVPVMPDYASGELGIFAVYPSRKHLSAKVRTFVDFLAEKLGS